MSWWRRPEQDPALGEALRRIESDIALSDADRLRQRIVAAAGSRLNRLEEPALRWWEWITAWSRLAVPVGLAASIGAALLIQGVTPALSPSSAVDAGSDSTLVVAALSDPSAGGQLAAGLIAPEEHDWLLQQAVGQ
jgi:hypothetical protein